MSGPKRELPPIHVKITGDPSGGLKAIQDVVDASKQAGKDIGAAAKKQTKLAQKELDKQYDDIVNFYKKTLKAGKDAAVKSYKERQKIVKAQEKEFRQQGKLTPAFARGARKYAKSSDFDLNALVKSGQAQTNEMAKQERVRRRELNRRNREMDKAYATERSQEDKRAAARVKQAQNGTVDFYRKASKVAKEQEKEARQSGTLLPAFAQTAKRYAKSTSPDLNALVKNAETEDTLIRRQARSRRLEMNRRNKQMDRAYQDEAKTADKAAATRQAQQTAERSTQQKASEQLAKEVQATRDRIAKQSKAMETEDLRVLRRSRIRKRDRLRQEKKDYADRVNTANKHLAKLVQSGAKSQATQVQNLKSANTKLAAQVKAGQVIQRNAASRQDREDARVLRRQRMRQRNRLQTRRDARQGQVAGLRQQGRALGSQAAGAMGGGGMMGARADMYMHQETLQSIGAGILGLVKPFAAVENYTVQMEAFAGSAQAAQQAVTELQAYAIKSPYSLEGVLNASTTMMKYGADTKHAIEMTKLLGDVAAGNTHKLELMSLAVGQAEALGRLQGQELRQMVNAGFNPLAVAAKEMAGPGADKAAIQKQMKMLQDNMRAGALDSGIIEAALKIATSKGGDFAGLADKQASTLTGLASQILETLDLVSIEIVKVFAGDLAAAMKEVKRYLDAVVEWAKANKDVVASYVQMGITILKWVTVFSAVAMALAYTKWILGSLFMVFGPFIAIIRVFMGVLMLFRTIWMMVGTAGMLSGIQTTIAWLAATAPIWGVVLAIAAVIAAFTLVWVLVEGFTSKRGFVGIFQDGMTAAGNFLGFMWNFGENFVNIFKFIGANWKLLVYDMLITNNPLISLARMGAKVLGFGDSFAGVESAAKTATMGALGGGTALDTSMFKFDGPKMPTLEDMGKMTGISDALAPHLKIPELPTEPPDKPNIDFNQFLGKGGPGGAGAQAIKAAPDHAMRGSSEHAKRMYEYGERVKPDTGAVKQDPQKQMLKFLTKIEMNTRPEQGVSPTSIEEAVLV